jgi:hypothetical protein
LRADKAAAREDLEAEAEEGEAGEKPGIYRPPRVAPMVYEEEVDRQRRREEKRRERARKSSMMKFIRTEFGSAPEVSATPLLSSLFSLSSLYVSVSLLCFFFSLSLSLFPI